MDDVYGEKVTKLRTSSGSSSLSFLFNVPISVSSKAFSDGVGQSEIGGSDASLSVMLSHEESMLTELSRLWKM